MNTLIIKGVASWKIHQDDWILTQVLQGGPRHQLEVGVHNSTIIRSPRDPITETENGNGTEIPCWGGDCTPQSSEKVIGSLG